VPTHPTPRPRSFPLFDGLRAIAALSVLVFHVGGQIGAYKHSAWGSALLRGNIGVTVFFVISGFLLYRPFVESHFGGPEPRSFTNYLRARALRIVPAYWLALAVLGFGVLRPTLHSTDAWRYLFFLQIYDHRTVFLGLAVAWTLCTEITFYLALPALSRAVAWGGRRLDLSGLLLFEIATITTLGTLSLCSRAIGPSMFAPRSVLSYTLLALFHWFALGMLLAVLSVAAERRVLPCWLVALTRLRTTTWCLAAACLVLAQLTVPHLNGNLASYGVGAQAAYGLFAFLLVWPAVWTLDERAQDLPTRVLANRTLAWLGLVSYGIYLWHVPVIQDLDPQIGRVSSNLVVRFFLLGGASVIIVAAVAALSYYIVERRLLRLKGRRASVPTVSPVTRSV
jgi:peptidoglycan/LPS O-acetylase OafA/YrhL